MNNDLFLAFYGDDFTGSTDALEALTRAGIQTALFLAPPTPAQLAHFSGLQAIGVAGLTRSLAPEAMAVELRPAFQALRALRPRHVHYKVCSTFDSSPTIGSIGRAIDLGAEVFGGRFVPLLVGAPALGRYCVFGHLFARFGIGSTGAIHRLDRHPSVSRHPVTPMTEADLRVHLGRQTTKRVGLLDVLALEKNDAELRATLDAILADGAGIVLFDVLRPEHLTRIGALLDSQAGSESATFSVGSSGVSSALAAHWNTQRNVSPIASWPAVAAAQPVLVVSGSCSPVTGGQIDWALAHGFHGLALRPDAANLTTTSEETLSALRAGQSTIVFTSRTPADHRDTAVPADVVGTALGRLARVAVERAGLRRVVFCGGDSSSYAARAFGLESVTMIAPLTPGAPLCRAHASSSPVDDVEVCFKGGQVGAEDFFGSVSAGNREN